jgi:hypothetical protein
MVLTAVRLAVPVAAFFLARLFLSNGDALLVAAVAYALLEARRRSRCFEASAPTLTRSRVRRASAMHAKA